MKTNEPEKICAARACDSGGNRGALRTFFSGTIKTITTAKVKITRGRSGRLEEKIQLNGKLTFPDVVKVAYPLTDGQTIQITKVNFRPGYTVNEGDVVIQARVANYDETMKGYQDDYSAAMESLQQLESKNANVACAEPIPRMPMRISACVMRDATPFPSAL